MKWKINLLVLINNKWKKTIFKKLKIKIYFVVNNITILNFNLKMIIHKIMTIHNLQLHHRFWILNKNL